MSVSHTLDMGHVIIDFSRVEEPEPTPLPEPAPKPDKLSKAKRRPDKEVRDRPRDGGSPAAPRQAVERLLGRSQELDRYDLAPEQIEAAKATFIASGGNVSEVCRVHDLAYSRVVALAAEHQWPVYGEGTTSVERTRKTRLIQLADLLEKRLFDLGDALGIERKHIDDLTEKGLGSEFVAPLNQRSSAFASVFDRYMRVMTLLEPETFGADDDPANPVAAKLRAKSHPDAVGGVEGIDRKLAEFAARVAVGVVDHMTKPEQGEVIEVEAE